MTLPEVCDYNHNAENINWRRSKWAQVNAVRENAGVGGQGRACPDLSLLEHDDIVQYHDDLSTEHDDIV
ncbi:hypothetical protein ACOMHN_030630 [Nucella lapillus]